MRGINNNVKIVYIFPIGKQKFKKNRFSGKELCFRYVPYVDGKQE